MPRKVSKRNILKEQSTIPQTGKYYKFCPCCHKNYWSDARGQKYCSSECQKKDYSRKKQQKKEYQEVAPVERLRVRYHALHVETVKMMCELGMRKWECEICGAKHTEGALLELHHKNKVWTDGTPSNLQLLCNKCHCKEHSKFDKDLDERGLLIEEVLPKSFLPLYKILNKLDGLD